MKIASVLKERMSFSFEVFPPKTDKGMENLKGAFQHYYKYKPDFISCTYGAGGSNTGRNIEVCQTLKGDGRTEVMTHFTCIGNSKEKIKSELDNYRSFGIENILAMRGDFQPGMDRTNGDFSNADALIKFVKTQFPEFCISAACYPEKHILAPSFTSDIAHLRTKQDNGAEFLMSQLCHDVEAYKAFADRIRKAGVHLPIVVGVMPALDKDAIIRMTVSNGCSVPRDLAAVIGKYGDNPTEFKKAGIEYTVNQIHRYMEAGINGLHLYALNKFEDLETILDASGIRKDI
ncbi:methylenetetrahydrofolate reductase [Parasporobacterium paucivorans]|uniref:Methylenetetrahydrofolate reductase n=1 Tax=Parasporobacterium paucivorans DSM 15970 TaxID=1122934 RepID=A0A1M6G9Z9_9FIRM|nr:methylenetetrahydrofolate reductase [Parasporobacterium paucivorans]SHJ06795.1 methylenetetrahydrofolate reductase (NADPH) [Parasporobacterium paucivorans DSM 15970]